MSFDVEPGEFVALVGPSGAGKTTTALLVPRIHGVVDGRVCVDRRDHHASCRDIAVVRLGVTPLSFDPALETRSIRARVLAFAWWHRVHTEPSFAVTTSEPVVAWLESCSDSSDSPRAPPHLVQAEDGVVRHRRYFADYAST